MSTAFPLGLEEHSMHAGKHLGRPRPPVCGCVGGGGGGTWPGTRLSWTVGTIRDATRQRGSCPSLAAGTWLGQCTHLFQKPVVLLLLEKVNVPRGDDAHQAAAHPARVGDGDAAEAMAGLGFKHIPHSVLGAEHHGVCDEALLVFLGERRTGISESPPSALGLKTLPLAVPRTKPNRHLTPRGRRRGGGVGAVHLVLFCCLKTHPAPVLRNSAPRWEKGSRGPEQPRPTSAQCPGALAQDPCPSDLHFPNFVGLEFRCAVVVDEANATGQL